MKNSDQKKVALLLLSPLLLLLLIFLYNLFQPPISPLPPETAPPVSTTKKAESPPKKASGYTATYFLRGKNRGICKALTGKILLNFYMVSDGDCIWTEEDVAEFKRTTEDAVYYLQYDASRYEVDLEVQTNFVFCTMDEVMARDDHKVAIPALLSSLGYENKYDAPTALAEEFAVDSVALLFCFNRQDRSHAYKIATTNGFEYAVLYGSKEDFRHEFFHLYGATDLYTPDEVYTVAKRFFPDSIMMRDAHVIDSLNAYNIGWAEVLDEHAKAFLEAVK